MLASHVMPHIQLCRYHKRDTPKRLVATANVRNFKLYSCASQIGT